MTMPRSHQPNPDTTPLHRAVEAGDPLTVEQMLAQGYGSNIPDRDGKTPLHWVGSSEVATLLINCGADVHAVNHGGYRPLHSASRRGCVEVAQALLKHGADAGATAGHYRLTPLHLAVDSGHVDVVKLLLTYGGNARAADWMGMTPIDVATERENDVILRLLQPEPKPTTPKSRDNFRMLTIG